MFALKNMDKLLILKLDMVYRSLSMEEAQARFSEATEVSPPSAETRTPAAPAKKVVKTIKPKSK